jgi:hypothetical protein
MIAAASLAWGIVPVTSDLVAETRVDIAPLPSSTVRPALKSNQVSKRNQGSAATLKGPVCLVHLFVRDAQSRWTESQRQTVRDRLQAAFGFLTSEARRYDIPLSIREKVLPDVVCTHPIPTDMFADPVWIEEVARKAGYGSVNRLIETVRNRESPLQTLLMVHVNKRSTSYNLSYYGGVDPEFYGERVVMYASYPSGAPTCAASYAHEILHAFGAGELFFPFDTTRQRYEMAKRWFANDITFRVDRDLDALSIGVYTAYRIGWRDRLERRYRVFDD